ncbi:protein mono-ADP-ribosyltransferase TIPARP-like isoform X1 [Seriola aureovittata]|uniref:protein mono-ADP-ribosyltransferase TIPARP-like isoform X1 n=3 Tax=Seriola aureovittata TaxID=2871759 RepID=UPI0024BE7487|nr:protein mono-ADP-ribosyltransferase TIPARP-like isoform X1 [Seriola aureovittata]XP_056223199.1 protein mono-ADP-ribosyltransferase TIPARP-like isoform X1 [Seriola aureovittata]
MADVASLKGKKRKMARSVLEPPSKSSIVTLLSPSLLLLEIPADTNTSLPVWEDVRSQQVDVAWTVNPYSISVHLTPMTSKQGKGTTSSKSESTPNVVQTSALSSGILQPQTFVQSIAQQSGPSQTVLLTFSQNSTQLSPCPAGQPQKIPPNHKPATSLIVSLPLIITQPQPASQPSATTKKLALPITQTPTTMPTKLQSPSKAPIPFPFHTRSSFDIQICDDFLLRLCRSGRKCKMHHTPYPFHWQLWSMTRHQWIDISPRSQVLLERTYCNIEQDLIFMKDGDMRYRLKFDLMELDDPSKYNRVRRLTNSDSLLRNPYFPSKWKIYWWNSFNWEQYNKNVSTLLLRKMSEKEPECSFYISSQEYKLDFTTMTQTNVTTGFQRAVRCRPVYRSPDSMHPYLQTGIQTDPTEPASGANFSLNPLEEFTSWYPPVWCLASEEDYSLVDVPAGTQAYRKVQSLFYESLPETKVDIISIQQVQNVLHWDKYQRHKAHMQKLYTMSKEPLERHLFHGTTKDASEDICHNNFDPRLAGVNGTSLGFGTYFATTASFSNNFSAKGRSDQLRHMFLAKVLVGKVSVGRGMYRRPPALTSKTRKYRLYDTCVDKLDKPTMFVVFDSCQCYPYYLIKYTDLPKEIDI